jgi:hypothetical protein
MKDIEGYPIHMKHYWSKSFQDYEAKLGKWQNAFWFRTELQELNQARFGEMMEKESLHAKYDVDMLVYVHKLTQALQCVELLRNT